MNMESMENMETTATETMTAVVHHRYGTPQTALEIREVATPRPASDEVLVRVHAAGVAIGDWLTVTGTPYVARPTYGLLGPKQEVAGYEMAGTVVAVGDNVAGFAPGDEVFGWGSGTFAEYTLSAGPLAHKPERLSFEEAAAVPVSGLAALQALRDAGRVEPGTTVLIVGASGAVGTFAVQVAKALGAEVTAVCSTRNVDLVRSLGADHVVDYTKEEIGDGGKRYDVIVDIAGNRSLSDLRGALTPTGTLVIVGGSGGKFLMGFDRTIRAGLLSPFVKQTLRPFISKPNQEDLAALRELIEEGKVTPVIDHTYPLAETVGALQYLAERHTSGKTVITV